MKKIVIFIILLLIFPSIAFADTAEVTVDCPNSKKKNEIIECEVKGNFSYGVSAMDYEFSYDTDKFTFEGFEADSTWEAIVDETSIALLCEKDHFNEFRMGKLKFKAKEKNANPNVKNKRLSVSDSDMNAIDIIDETNENVNEEKKFELKKATTSNNKLIYDIIIIIVVIVILLIMMGLVIIKIIRSDTK